jgi:hypothetical protein
MAHILYKAPQSQTCLPEEPIRNLLRCLTLGILPVLIMGTSLDLRAITDAPAGVNSADQSALVEAAAWIQRDSRIETEYRYVMTCKLRLLFFWVGRDDVGGGYIRMGKSVAAPPQQMIQILFGSDPAKAPRAINRWGAGTEILRNSDSGLPPASAFFGFMKSSKGQSVGAMRQELSKEKSHGDHLFEGIISRVDGNRALSTTVPYASSQDFNLHQYAEAEKATLQQLESSGDRKIRRLDGAGEMQCPRVGGFLSTMQQLVDDALAGRPVPASLCYVYNARHYTATLLGVHPVAQRAVHVALRRGASLDSTYRKLQEAHFEVVGKETESKSSFDILIGTEGKLRGAPVQITYEPNWWFQVILNLLPDSSPSDDRKAPPRPKPGGGL